VKLRALLGWLHCGTCGVRRAGAMQRCQQVAAAEAAASGAGAVSSDLLHAVAKNIESSARSRTLRMFSLVARCSVEARKLETGQE